MARQHEKDLPDGITGRRGQILNIIGPMMVDFKRELAKMRADGATQAEIETMLAELDERYAFGANVEGELVVAVLREAARLPKQITKASRGRRSW